MLLQQAVNRDSPRGIDIDCFWLSITLPLGQVLLIFFLSLALAPILSWALTVLQEALILAFHVVLSTLYMAYAASRS